MIVTQRERGRDTGRGRSRLHALGARRGIRSRVSRIVPWAKGRRQTAAPPRDPYIYIFFIEVFLPSYCITPSTHPVKCPPQCPSPSHPYIKNSYGIPGWHSGLAPAFGPGRDPGDPGSNPTTGSRCLEPASPSAYVSASLSVTIINK